MCQFMCVNVGELFTRTKLQCFRCELEGQDPDMEIIGKGGLREERGGP